MSSGQAPAQVNARRKVAVLGSTGSVGTSALDVIGRFPERFEVVGLAAGNRIDLLAEQIRTYRPEVVSVRDESGARTLRAALGAQTPRPEILVGQAGACTVARLESVDFVLAAIAGSAGMLSTAAAVEAGKTVGLANKESMVLAGEYLMAQARRTGAPILPVDSEHSAIFQCLAGHHLSDVRRLVLTASGGPFRTWDAEKIRGCTPEEALQHPNWTMGDKITIDSA